MAETDWLTGPQVRAICGNVTNMTIWRWTEEGKFPKPDQIINGRRYWERGTIERWKAGRARIALPARLYTSPIPIWVWSLLERVPGKSGHSWDTFPTGLGLHDARNEAEAARRAQAWLDADTDPDRTAQS
jgi:predicted DNA-binding transcriptional regulator AlpA